MLLRFWVPKALPVDSISRVLMIAVCFPYPMRFALKKLLVSLQNLNQNVDSTALGLLGATPGFSPVYCTSKLVE